MADDKKLKGTKKKTSWDEPAFDTSNMSPSEKFFCPTKLEYEIANEMVDIELKRNKKGSY